MGFIDAGGQLAVLAGNDFHQRHGRLAGDDVKRVFGATPRGEVLQGPVNDKSAGTKCDIKLDGWWQSWLGQCGMQFGIFAFVVSFAVQGEGDDI